MKQREPTKDDFISLWGHNGYKENFDVYSRKDRGGATEREVVDAGLAAHFDKNAVCLEVGCGGGYWLNKWLCPRFKHVYGLDVVPYTGHRPDNLTFIEVPDRNYSCYGIEDESIDFVWSFGVFCHIPVEKVGEYVKSVYRVLKPGSYATLYFSNDDRRPGCFTTVLSDTGIIWAKNDLQTSIKMMEDAGFVDIVDVLPTMRDTLLTGFKAK